MTNREQNEVPKQWEYKSVSCYSRQIERLSDDSFSKSHEYSREARKQEQSNRRKLYNPKLWDQIPEDSNRLYNLAWSDTDKYYTWVDSYLNELGQEGWEIVKI